MHAIEVVINEDATVTYNRGQKPSIASMCFCPWFRHWFEAARTELCVHIGIYHCLGNSSGYSWSDILIFMFGSCLDFLPKKINSTKSHYLVSHHTMLFPEIPATVNTKLI